MDSYKTQRSSWIPRPPPIIEPPNRGAGHRQAQVMFVPEQYQRPAPEPYQKPPPEYQRQPEKSAALDTSTLKVSSRLKGIRRASGEWLQIVSFLGGDDSYNGGQAKRRHSAYGGDGGKPF